MNASSLMLKVIVMIHFMLSVWGSMGQSFLPPSYIYAHIVVLLCGLWAIAASESVDAVLMLLVTLAFSILQDIILLGLYQPRAYNTFERPGVPASSLNEYRFALGMAILNLILKPFTGFLVFRIYQTRNNETAFNIPGIDRIPGLSGIGGGGGGGGGYEDIDRQPSPHAYSVPVESARPHETVDKE